MLCPSATATRISDSQRNREGTAAELQSATAVESFLREFCAAGLDPSDVALTIVEAIKRGDFLIPTRETFAEFVRVRADALVRKELPPFQMFD